MILSAEKWIEPSGQSSHNWTQPHIVLALDPRPSICRLLDLCQDCRSHVNGLRFVVAWIYEKRRRVCGVKNPPSEEEMMIKRKMSRKFIPFFTHNAEFSQLRKNFKVDWKWNGHRHGKFLISRLYFYMKFKFMPFHISNPVQPVLWTIKATSGFLFARNSRCQRGDLRIEKFSAGVVRIR